VRHLIIKNFECKYSTLVLSCNNIKTFNQITGFRSNSILNFINESPLEKKLLKDIKNVVLWDKPENTSFYLRKFLFKVDRNKINITTFNKSIIIGVMLSDGYLEKRKGWNPRIRIEQSIKYIEYIWYLFNQLAVLVNSYPYMIKRNLRGKWFYSLSFKTRQLNSINEIYNLFYNGENKKCLNISLIHYFNYIVLAHWIMGDGSKMGKGIILCTDSFSIVEVVLLMNILLIKYDVSSTIHYVTFVSLRGEKINNIKAPRIYINGKNLDKIRLYIKPYILNCFLYKIE